MTRITIEGLEVFAYHGVTPEEKERGQRFVVDAEMELEGWAAAEDDIGSTVDYATVARRLSEIATSNRFDLVETLARASLEYLLSLEGVNSARVTVRKPDAPMPVTVGCVAVTVEGSGAPGGKETTY